MTSEPSAPPRRWQLVVPVKRAEAAKTRLDPPHPLSRPELARAVAADTLAEVCRALPPGCVAVVTSDPSARSTGLRLGARVVPDPGGGLDAAVRAGLAPDVGGADDDPPTTAWAVLLGDLPALRAIDLADALATCAAFPQAVVPDADGTGTVLLTSTTGPPQPRFGSGSLARHAEAATVLPLELPRLRRDVDTWADLREAVELGVGPRTREALAHLE